MRWFRPLRTLRNRRRLESEMAEEMRLHLEQRTREFIADGLTPEEACAAAHRRFGGVAQAQEQVRDARPWRWLDQLLQDGRHAVRQVGRNRGFTTTIVLTLALGIAVCTAIFSLVDALLFRPLPVRDAPSLLAVTFMRSNGWPAGPVSAPYFREVRSHNRSFAELTAYASILVRLRIGDEQTKSALGQMVPRDYFEVLGVQPIIGRTFAVGKDAGSDPGPVALISHAFWHARFGGDPGVLGRSLQLNDQMLTIVGVVPSDFAGLDSKRDPLFWVPDTLERPIGAYTLYEMVGRLAPGVTPQQASSELDALIQGLTAAHGSRPPPGYERYGFVQPQYHATLQPAAIGSWPIGHLEKRRKIGRLAALFGGAVALVFLVACSNAASLLLVRALRRRREIAVRVALGATRSRLVRQLLIESLLLSAFAAAVGVVLAHWGTEGLLALRAGTLSHIPIEPRVDGRVLTFAVGLTTFTGLFFGLVPALQALRFDVQGTLKQEAGAATARFRRLAPRSLLVLGQVTLSLVLLIGAGLCLRSFSNLLRIDPGFDRRNVLTIGFNETEFGRPRPAAVGSEWTRQMIERVAKLPGVREVSASDQILPLSGNFAITRFDDLEGYVRKPGEEIHVAVRSIGPGYFHLLGIPVTRGREFDLRDLSGTAKVALVNESFVRRYWPDQDPLGKHIKDAEIIGVVGDVRSRHVWEEPQPQVFSILFRGFIGGPITLLVRTEEDPTTLAPLVQGEITPLAGPWEVSRVESLENVWSASLAGQRLTLVLLAIFSGTTLLLAIVGLYGCVACFVAQRTREIGIRVAVGAQRIDIMRLVMREGMTIIAIGLACGILIALPVVRPLDALLHGVTPTDGTTFVLVPLLLGVTALVACWLPARRAAKVDPVEALRAE